MMRNKRRTVFRFLCYNLDGYATIHVCDNVHERERYIAFMKGNEIFARHLAE